MADSKQVLADRIIFDECFKQHALPNMLTADAPTMIKAYDGKKQTPPTAPVVMINDLSKNHGNQVYSTIIHDLNEKPSMGISKREGYEEDITTANFPVKIDQYHKSVKVSLMMEQQKVGYNRKKLGRPLLTRYHGQLLDEICVYVACGARGTYDGDDRLVPVASDADFDAIMVNPVTAPTYERKMYAGAATGISSGTAITTSDTFDVASVRKFKESIELMANPPKPVSMAGEDHLYIGFITPKMWTDYETASDDFQTQISNAIKRTSGFTHPLFKGEMFVKDDILFKKYNKPVGWQEGETVKVCANDNAATEADETVPAGVTVERGFILGGQAIALAYGNVLPGGKGNFKMDGELFDMNAWWRQWMDWIMGMAKVRFANSFGKINDYGIIAFDAAV